MAVEFTSYGYDTVPGAGLGELTWQEMFPQIGTGYGVRNPTDWQVTPVSGADRTVSITAGRGWGLGVIDKTVANDTIQLDPVAGPAGTVRWDLIACRRDPTPTAGVSSFIKINGGATPVIPAARLSGPGIHDQPLALVPVIAGQTQPGTIIDLRTWSGLGGGFVAVHDLVRSFLNQTGTRINILGMDWIRRPGANNVPEWYCPDEPTVYAPLTIPGYSITGEITVKPAGSKREVTVDINVTRTGAAGSIPGSDWANFGAVIPTGARGDADPDYLPVSVIGGTTSTATTNAHATVFLNPANGIMQIRGIGSFTWNPGALFSLSTSYYI